MIGPNNYIKKCETLLEKQLLCKKVLLTNSGTDALEMACILANFGLNDEIIMPSFNFPSSATAVLRCGAKPVFVEIDKETYSFYCNDKSLSLVAERLEKKLGESELVKLIWKPKNYLSISHDQQQKLIRLMDALENDDDVQNIYTNTLLND